MTSSKIFINASILNVVPLLYNTHHQFSPNPNRFKISHSWYHHCYQNNKKTFVVCNRSDKYGFKLHSNTLLHYFKLHSNTLLHEVIKHNSFQCSQKAGCFPPNPCDGRYAYVWLSFATHG